jgi:hypothetical protein
MNTPWEYSQVDFGLVPVEGEMVWTAVMLNGRPWNFERSQARPIEMLNALGSEGWEVVSQYVLGDSSDPEQVVLSIVLKRQRLLAKQTT